MGHSFHLMEGPGGQGGSGVGGQKRIPAQPGPGTSITLEEKEHAEPPPDTVCPRYPRPAPGGRPGQGGSQCFPPRSLPKRWGLVHLRRQLLSLPSPEAREAATGLWTGQMAGDKLGGTAERWKVSSGHLAMPLATQLFLPRGGWEQPWQQAEAKVTEEGRQGPPPPHGKPAQGGGSGSARP